MAQINLLPWRERLREERRREFLTIMVGVIIIAGGLIFLVDRYFSGEINTQEARNSFLRGEIQQLDAMVAEINQLREQKEAIRARMNVITDLQGTRPVIVRIFDELVKTLPGGVYYSSIERTDQNISLEGVAESYARITELMRRLDASAWFMETNLSDISAEEGEDPTSESLSFSITLTMELPNQDGLDVL